MVVTPVQDILQYMMNFVLHHTKEICVYIDDVKGFNNEFEEHIFYLDNIFQVLQDNGFSIDL